MDSKAKIYLNRAFNEIQAAEILFKISNDDNKKKAILEGSPKNSK